MMRFACLALCVVAACGSSSRSLGPVSGRIARAIPYEQDPVWRTQLDVPFVDIFHVVQGRGLLVGAMGWDNNRFTFIPKTLRFLDLGDGREIWRAERNADVASFYAVAAHDASVVIVQRTGLKSTSWSIHALADGIVRGTFQIEGFGSATLVGERLFVARGDHVWAVDLDTGRSVWERSVPPREGGAIAEVIAGEGDVCIVDATAACVDTVSGKLLWESPLPDRGAVGALLHVDGNLAVATDESLSLIDRKTGKVRWRVMAPSRGSVGLQRVDTGLLATWLLDQDNGVYQMVAIADGKVRWTNNRLSLPRSGFLQAGGRLLFTSALQVHAIEVKTGKQAAREWLPRGLVYPRRTGENLAVRGNELVVIADGGIALYDVSTLRETSHSAPAVALWGHARTFADYATKSRATTSERSKASPVVIADTSSPGIAAAKARIDLAYAQTRLVSKSPTASSDAKIAASEYRQNVITGSISSAEASIAAGRVAAGLNLAASVSGGMLSIVEAIQLERQREMASWAPLDTYRGRAADLRVQGTPANYFIGASTTDLFVFHPGMVGLAQFTHSDERDPYWQHVASIDLTHDRVIGAHVSRRQDTKSVRISNMTERFDLDVESYALASGTQLAPSTSRRDVLDAVRSRKITRASDAITMTCSNGFGDDELDTWYAALTGNNVQIIRDVYDNGRPYITDLGRNQFTFEDVARVAGEPEMIALLSRARERTKQYDDLYRAADRGDARAVAALLDSGLNPNGSRVKPDGKTNCETNGLLGSVKPEIMEVLLEHGADVNMIDGGGRTALDWAIMGDRGSAIRLLRSRGGKRAAELTQPAPMR